MARMIGFMATWTTYGTWLQGNKKGYVKNGTILGANAELEKSNKELVRHDKIKIPKSLRKKVKNAILKEAEEIGQKIYALAVSSNHVHIVVESIATKALRKHGFANIVWTKGFDKRYCYHQHELEMKIKYVQRHED